MDFTDLATTIMFAAGVLMLAILVIGTLVALFDKKDIVASEGTSPKDDEEEDEKQDDDGK